MMAMGGMGMVPGAMGMPPADATGTGVPGTLPLNDGAYGPAPTDPSVSQQPRSARWLPLTTLSQQWPHLQTRSWQRRRRRPRLTLLLLLLLLTSQQRERLRARRQLP